MAMNFDQPEAQLFFGLRNKTSCSKCKWRKGYSAFRKKNVSCQVGTSVRMLYAIASTRDNTAAILQQAKEKLLRWGFNPERQCCLYKLLETCPKLFICLPSRDEVTPSVDFRDKMHGLFIFFFRTFIETWEVLNIAKATQRIMITRLKIVCGQNVFHYYDGKAYKKQRNLFSGAGTSAKDKVAILFLLAHVLGHDAAILPPALRLPMLTALAHVQLMFIASSGSRSYSEDELKQIFDSGYVVVFRAFEQLHKLARIASENEQPSIQSRCVLG